MRPSPVRSDPRPSPLAQSAGPGLSGPLPGTERRPRGLFVDRWGTLLEQPGRGYCTSFDPTVLLPGVVDGLFRAVQAGWLVYLIGNEDAVAHGKLAERTWRRVEADLVEHLRSLGVPIRRSYACIDDPDGKGPHRRPSVFRLPNTGLFYHAAQIDHVELRESWVVGDSSLELVSGSRSGCRLAAVATGLALGDGAFHVEPDVRARDLTEVLDLLLGSEAWARPA